MAGGGPSQLFPNSGAILQESKDTRWQRSNRRAGSMSLLLVKHRTGPSQHDGSESSTYTTALTGTDQLQRNRCIASETGAILVPQLEREVTTTVVKQATVRLDAP